MGEIVKEERYTNLDGLRAIASVGIVMMHVLANVGCSVEEFVFVELIPSFTQLVFLFMIISCFSMCCGYFEQVSKGTISPNEFYSKRFAKIWPFFALLTAAELIVSPSIETLYEAFANLTLCFGLLPNHKIEVVGVGWTLGVIFVFYLMFPFVCFLLSNRRRAWFALIVAVLFNWVCKAYFFDEEHMLLDYARRTNILYCSMYFLAGGMIYLYRDQLVIIASRFRKTIVLLIIAITICYYMWLENEYVLLLLYSVVLIYVIGLKSMPSVLNNKVVCLMGKYSMEVYLSHMFIYRVIEKLDAYKLFDSYILSYFTTVLLTYLGALLFAFVVRQCFKKLSFIKGKLTCFLNTKAM